MKRIKRMKWSGTCCFVFVFLALALNANATVATAPFTGAPLSGLAVLAGTTQTNVNTTVTGGNVVSPTITGPLAVIGGSAITVAGTVTTDQTALGSPTTGAEGVAAGEGPCTPIAGGTIGTATLGPGVFCASSALLLTGTLTLSGNSTDVWVFQVGSALTAQIGSSVVFAGTASPCNVFWQVVSKADITTQGPFAGTIMAGTSITLGTTALGNTLNGRALANAAVTIAGTETINSGCSTSPLIVLSPVHSSIVCGSGSSVTKIATVTVGGNPAPDGTSVTFTVKVGTTDTGLGGTVTTVGGIATFTFIPNGTLTSSTPYTVVATLSDGTSSNITDVTCSGSNTTDFCRTAPYPTVTIGATTTDSPKRVFFSIRALGGLFTFNSLATNATVAIQPFDIGTTGAVAVIATKINQSASAVIQLTVTDLICGHTTVFDPVFATITISASRSKERDLDFDHREVTRYNGIGHTEGRVTLQNGTGTPGGVESVVIRVNGSQFRTQLKDGQTKTIDISSALFHRNNTVRVAAFGDSGSSVDLTISDE